MANPVENAAFVSVGRACGFAGLAVLCVVMGLSFDPARASGAGAQMSLIICVILLVRAWRAPVRPYHRTETWLILPKGERPSKSIAQRLVSTALRDAYLWFAEKACLITIVFASTSFALQLGGGS